MRKGNEKLQDVRKNLKSSQAFSCEYILRHKKLCAF